MEYEYRELSKEKCEQLNVKKFANMYNSLVGFDGGCRCVTTPDEGIVFTQIGYSHENYIANEFFLNFSDWYFYAYVYEKSQGRESNGVGVNYCKLNIIERISNATLDKPKEKVPAEAEVLAILKEVLPVWNQNHHGRLNPGDQIITTGVEYKGVML